MCKCNCEGDAHTADVARGDDGAHGSGDVAGEMLELRTAALCSGGISHQASFISRTCNNNLFLVCL